MSFETIDDFLGRNNDQYLNKLMNEWNIYFEKLTYFGGWIFNEILKKGNLGKEDSLPLIMLLRNAIELIDSISVLIYNSCSEPARIILRTLLETYFYCQYITENDSKRRSLSFLICQHHEKLDFQYKLNPTTQQGKQFACELSGDDNLDNYLFARQPLLRGSIHNLERLIKEEIYSEVEEEYQRLKKAFHRRKPCWFEFYGGPSSIDKLAKHLKQYSLYHFLYRSLSKNTHGSHIIDNYISPGDTEEEVAFSQIRFPYSAQMVTQFTFTLAMRIYRILIKYHLPDMEERLNRFYLNEIRDFYSYISKNQAIVVERH